MKQQKQPIHGKDVLDEVGKLSLDQKTKHTLLLVSLKGPDDKLESQGALFLYLKMLMYHQEDYLCTL